MRLIRRFTSGDGLLARTARSSALTIFGFGSSQVIRLASNLILTRLLFPEAFGLMALVLIFMQGLANFSDVGLGPSIMQNKRGDDQEFLDTAWTIQVVRGFMLWAAASLISGPAASFYNAPQLAVILPVATLALVIDGFLPTRLETAARHLVLGRVTIIEIASQIAAIIAAVVFAWLTQSVWALVISGIVFSVAHLVLACAFLPGKWNRFRWDKSAASELIHFGKWIFISTVCGFVVSQGDKMVLGKYLQLGQLGIYNIGYYLASFPLILGGVVIRRILIPVYRERPPSESDDNFQKIRKLRFALTGGTMMLVIGLTFFGVSLVHLLYSDQFASSGAILVLVGIMQLPIIIGLSYDQAALASGDSKSFFVLSISRAVALIAGLLIGVETAGIFGAIIGQGIAMLLVYPVVIWLARKQAAWDPVHDAIFFVIGLIGGGVVLWVNSEEIIRSFQLASI